MHHPAVEGSQQADDGEDEGKDSQISIMALSGTAAAAFCVERCACQCVCVCVDAELPSATLSASTQVSPSKRVERLSDMKRKGCIRLHVICAVSCAISPGWVEVTHKERSHITDFFFHNGTNTKKITRYNKAFSSNGCPKQ